MTDYRELVKALRCKSLSKQCDSCKYGYRLCPDSECNDACHVEQIYADAAAAIEALQDTVQAQDKALKECARQLAKMGPKRGEWIEDATTYAGPGRSNYKCSLCGKICGTWRSGLKHDELPNWCGNCGADMRKMEVQDG